MHMRGLYKICVVSHDVRSTPEARCLTDREMHHRTVHGYQSRIFDLCSSPRLACLQ